jgi:hypothetical protein
LQSVLSVSETRLIALPAQPPPNPLVLTGRVVTFDPDPPIIADGAVYIGANELIAAVQKATAKPPDALLSHASASVQPCGEKVYPTHCRNSRPTPTNRSTLVGDS